MIGLSQLVHEALFETKFAIGEIVQFIPTSSDLTYYDIATAEYIVGRIEQIIIGPTGQFYDLSSDLGFFKGVHESNVKQDMGVILTRPK